MSGPPKAIGNILAELMARRGYAQVQAASQCTEAWREAAGEVLARHSRATQIRRGVLEVICSNSTMIQEMSFQKAGLLKRLTELLPHDQIRDLKFRVGPIQ
jgi:predicted nucleic acid-binding Zn ribbon protein